MLNDILYDLISCAVFRKSRFLPVACGLVYVCQYLHALHVPCDPFKYNKKYNPHSTFFFFLYFLSLSVWLKLVFPATIHLKKKNMSLLTTILETTTKNTLLQTHPSSLIMVTSNPLLFFFFLFQLTFLPLF